MSKLNFSIALKMTTDQFKRGADIVKNSLRQIQFQAIGMAGALGLGGVGLKNMVSRFVDVARETTRARVALRNISGGVEGFTKNMDFLLKSSNRWGQELNGMTAEFSKFSAAASSAGISIQDQHTIFESFTRSITAFGMKSEDAHLSYLALSQMMSKGKVSSEELRRQLGERMPIAMEAMARAVGVTIQELDGLLKAGKLVSKDVMLPFVKEMEKMLPEVNTDNIETSLNRLKNTFTKLTQDLKVGDMYKKIVDEANKMLSNIQTSFARIALVIINSIAGAKIIGAFVKLQAQSSATNTKILAEKQRTEFQMQAAAQKRVAAEKVFSDYSVLYNKASNDQKLQYYGKYVASEKALDKARLNEKAAINAFEVASAAKTTTVWSLAWKNIKVAAVTAFATIKAAFSTFLPMAVFGILTNFVMKLIEARKEAEKIKNTFSDYKKEAKLVNAGEEVEKIKTLHKIVKERLGTDEEINNAQSELLKKLGVEEGKQKDINKLVIDRIALLEAAASADFYARRKVETDEDIKRIYGKYGGESQMNKQFVNAPKNKGFINNWLGWEDPVETDMSRLVELKKVSEDAAKEMLKAEQIRAKYLDGSTTTTTTTNTPTGDPNDKDKKTDLQKAEEKYAEELKKLTNQKEANAIKTEEYNKSIDDLNKATYEEIAGILGANAERNKTFQLAKDGVEKPLSAQTELAKLTEDYNKSLKTLDEKKRLGISSEEEYNNELINLINSTIDKAASFERIGQAEEEYIANLKNLKPGLVKDPQKESRDSTFDYKKSKSDIIKEDLDIQKKYAEDIKAKFKEAGDLSVEALNRIAEEEAKVTSLSDALKLAQLKEDLEDLNTDIFSTSIDGVTGFANGLDRIANSWSRLANEDMSGFERMVAIINALGDTIKGITDTYEKFNSVKDLMAQKDKLRVAQDSAMAAQKVGNAATEVAASQAVATGNLVEGASDAGKGALKLPFPYNLIAAGGAIAAAIALFKSIPGFANGGIIGGVSRTGDKNLIRANAGEMVLTTTQQSGLWNAMRRGDFGGGINGKVEFEIKGDRLSGVLRNHDIKKSRI